MYDAFCILFILEAFHAYKIYSGGLEHAHRDSDDDLDYELPSGPDEGVVLSD